MSPVVGCDSTAQGNKVTRNTNVCLFYMTDTDVSNMDDYLNKVILHPIPGTMAFHQLISLEKGQVYCRRLSCFCETRKCCPCFKPFKHQFPVRAVASTTTQVHVSPGTIPDTRVTSSEESDPASPDFLNPVSTLVTERSDGAVAIQMMSPPMHFPSSLSMAALMHA